jgi:proline racemase
MKISKVVTVIDAHTEGQPMRIVTGGFPNILVRAHFVHESIIGTLFRGKIVGESREGEYSAIIPEVTGNAYITGFQHLVVENGDPFKSGFILA